MKQIIREMKTKAKKQEMNNIIRENRKNKKTIGNEEHHQRNEEKSKKKQEMKKIIKEKSKKQKTIGN